MLCDVSRETLSVCFCVWRLSDKEATTEGGGLIKRRLYGAGGDCHDKISFGISGVTLFHVKHEIQRMACMKTDAFLADFI